MRRYRAWHIAEKCMYNVPSIDFILEKVYLQYEDSSIYLCCSFDKIVLMEETGLQDKNGVKIFEGDIVKDKDILHDGEIQMEGVISEVKFNNGCWIISSADFGWGFLHTNCNTITVIGNIYDNPELLGSIDATKEGENG